MINVECYDAKEMPLSNDIELRTAQEKIINGEELSFREKILVGRDHPVKTVDNYQLKSNCVYRAISKELYDKYVELGYIYGTSKDDEYEEIEENSVLYNNNRGVDWYLGGISLRYGEVIIECPASKEYFVPAYDNGCHLSYDPTVRHMKSSGYKNPVPIDMVRLIKHPDYDIDLEEKKGFQM